MRSLAAVVITVAAFSCARADTPAEATRKAVTLTQAPWPATLSAMNAGTRAKATVDFAGALDIIARGIPKSQRERTRSDEAESIENKLAAIALDREERPEVYQEIWAQYGHGENTRSGSPPPVVQKHATEAYRLAWEFYLLAPVQTVSPGYWRRAAEAIGTIGDARSCPTLLHELRAGIANAGSAAPLRECVACRMALDALAWIAKPEALESFAAAFPVAVAPSDPANVRRADALAHMAKKLRNIPEERQAAWRAVLEEGKASSNRDLRDLALELEARWR